MIIDLTKPLDLPEEFIHRLGLLDGLFRSTDSLDDLGDINDAASLIRDIDAYCCEGKIIGIHYTRAVQDSIRSQGLLIRSGAEIRNSFLLEHGYRFTSREIEVIKAGWASYFSEKQRVVRDNRIFFNFTKSALRNGGAKYLIGLYGGEQVSMSFDFYDPIGAKLAEIGEPLIVRCALDPSEIKAFTEYPWGKALVSSYHIAINQNAYRFDQDGFQVTPVSPEDIIEILVLPEREVTTQG